MSYVLPKFHFHELPQEVMDEIMRGMESALPKAPEPTWEELEKWLDCTKVPGTIRTLYKPIEERAPVRG